MKYRCYKGDEYSGFIYDEIYDIVEDERLGPEFVKVTGKLISNGVEIDGVLMPQNEVLSYFEPYEDDLDKDIDEYIKQMPGSHSISTNDSLLNEAHWSGPYSALHEMVRYFLMKYKQQIKVKL